MPTQEKSDYYPFDLRFFFFHCNLSSLFIDKVDIIVLRGIELSGKFNRNGRQLRLASNYEFSFLQIQRSINVEEGSKLWV